MTTRVMTHDRPTGRQTLAAAPDAARNAAVGVSPKDAAGPPERAAA